MTKTSKELIVTGFLAVALALFVVSALNKARKEDIAKEDSEKRDAVESVKTPAAGKLEQQSERAKMKWGRDPFFEEGVVIEEEGVREVPAGEEPSLKGILWSEKNPIALINMQSVTIGESVSGYVVVDIQRDKVVLRKDGKDYEFKLKK